jgi:hypothetical protein
MNKATSTRVKLDWSNLLGYSQVKSVQGTHKSAVAQAKIGSKIGAKAGFKGGGTTA